MLACLLKAYLLSAICQPPSAKNPPLTQNFQKILLLRVFYIIGIILVQFFLNVFYPAP